MKDIIIKGARQHNLKGIDVTIPRNSFVVITGLSGSGKSSLAFDTLYAEGQRRYVESLSTYARQFLDQMQKPDVEHIEGLSPAIAIEQRSSGVNPRSTVATTTEIYDYLRVLYSRVGKPHCPKCGKPVHAQSAQAVCEKILKLPADRKLIVLAPYIIGRKGEHKEVLEKLRKDGFVRARIDGKIIDLDSEISLEKNIKHTIEAVIDRLKTGKLETSRITDSVELALRCGDGLLTILYESNSPDKKWEEEQISEHLACLKCSISFGKLEPRNFSFNSPYGACSSCNGLGTKLVIKPERIIVDENLSIKKGAIPIWRRGPRRLIIYYNHLLRRMAEHLDFPDLIKTPIKDMPDSIRSILFYGTGEEIVNFDYWHRGKQHKLRKPFEGIVHNLERRYVETESDSVRSRLRDCMVKELCPKCKGARLKPSSLAVTVGAKPIHKFNELSVKNALKFVSNIKLSEEDSIIASEILNEIKARLGFLSNVGLTYLSLDRESSTLSGGEAQRIRLATQLGSGLVGVIYILDEPSIGLHQRDNDRLLETLINLRDTGNTVVVVEHDLDTIKKADHIIDLGPGAGRLGGNLIYSGPPKKITNVKNSLTAEYITEKREIKIPENRFNGNGKNIKIIGAEQNNLKNIDVEFPLGKFICVTGVSGSGKSSLINDILRIAVNRYFNIGREQPGKHKEITGIETLGKSIVIDQTPIGRTPRSNPATYTDAFTLIRQLYSKLPESRMRGYKPGRFSFNVKGGRCEECKGDGIKKIEMLFLPDVYVQCSVCKGRRFNNETLNVLYKGKSIADVLDMTVNEATEFFDAIPNLYRKLKTLVDVGLGYIHLGQPATTLSGGEAQRVKLATELAKRQQGHTLYILDEPTTGLHIADVEKLLAVLLKLRDQDNTILVIEHNLDVIKVADHIIDLGPEGGDKGGKLIAQGTPEEVAKVKKSYTGQYLKSIFK
ncbi:MAG TPA: excinuclease ABC subunit UvrA [Victivallales bacterium]|nr:excinuclease ABC subunit UvrA [Victivallales bacterium]